MIIDSIRNYMRNLKCLDTFNAAIRVNVNYLDPDIDTYSIEEVPIDPILKKYVNGDSIRQYAFIFISREPYGADVLTNIDNAVTEDTAQYQINLRLKYFKKGM